MTLSPELQKKMDEARKSSSAPKVTNESKEILMKGQVARKLADSKWISMKTSDLLSRWPQTTDMKRLDLVRQKENMSPAPKKIVTNVKTASIVKKLVTWKRSWPTKKEMMKMTPINKETMTWKK